MSEEKQNIKIDLLTTFYIAGKRRGHVWKMMSNILTGSEFQEVIKQFPYKLFN